MPGNPLSDPNWANDVTDQIISTIGSIRDKTTNNVITLVRGVVYGLLAIFLGIVALVVILILVTRLIQGGLDFLFEHGRSVYISYFIVGGLLTVVGWWAMGKRFGDS